MRQVYDSSPWPDSLISESSVWWQRSDCQAHWQAISPVLVQAAVVVWMHTGGAILLIQPAMTTWELPGGKLEAKEDPKEALVRELWEELAITVEPAQLIALGSTPMGWAPQQPMVHFYLWHNDQQLPQPQEQQRIVWVPPEQISHYANVSDPCDCLSSMDSMFKLPFASLVSHCSTGAETGCR